MKDARNSDIPGLIDALSTGLRPVRPALPAEWTAALWLAASAVFVVGATALAGPIRPNALAQLASEPRFLLETLLGAVAIACTGVMAVRSAVPGGASRRGLLIALGLLALWLANYGVDLKYPALEPSMLGKRDHCFSETLLFALPPVGLALLLARRLYPLTPVRTGLLFSLAAGMLPALYMQLACMYSPAHILQMHIVPGLMVMVAGGVCTWLVTLLQRR